MSPEVVPKTKDLAKAYSELSQNRQKTLPLSQLAQYTQWVRFDARLGEIIVKYVNKHWLRINPLDLNQWILKQVWPAVPAVLLDQVSILQRESKLSSAHRDRYRKWRNVCLHEVEKASNELFFLGQFSVAGKSMRKEVLLTVQVYSQWGYFGRDIMINKFQNRNQTLMSRPLRMKTLERFCSLESPFSVTDYLSALDFAISRRQAQRDIQSFPGLQALGHTRNKKYIILRK